MLSFPFLDKVNPAVKAEQVRLLYSQGFTIQLLGIITAIVCVVMLWKVADHTKLAIWLMIMVAISLVRLGITVKFTRRTIDDNAMERWGNVYVAGTFLSGIIWGLLAFLYDPSWPAPYQVMLFVIYTGIIAGAFNTNTSLFIAFPAFYIPPVICLMYVMLRQSGDGFLELSSLFLIYIALMYVSALKFHRRLTHALQIRFENEKLAAELTHANQNLMQLADIDGLTNLYNRRSMDKYLESEWNRHFRSQEPLSLLFIDLDCFKQYNDTYGHEGGDQCLIKIASILEMNAQRSTDMAARYGGEEFAVILPATEAAQAQSIAESIRSDLKVLNIPHSSSSVSGIVTMSIGVVTMTPQQLDGADLLRVSADKALYRAKKEGRDRIVTEEVCLESSSNTQVDRLVLNDS